MRAELNQSYVTSNFSKSNPQDHSYIKRQKNLILDIDIGSHLPKIPPLRRGDGGAAAWRQMAKSDPSFA